MTREETLITLHRMRGDIETIRRYTDSPALESAMRNMGVYCYLARSYLGEIDAICPEVDEPG